jgi:hypothetical protein
LNREDAKAESFLRMMVNDSFDALLDERGIEVDEKSEGFFQKA